MSDPTIKEIFQLTPEETSSVICKSVFGAQNNDLLTVYNEKFASYTKTIVKTYDQDRKEFGEALVITKQFPPQGMVATQVVFYSQNTRIFIIAEPNVYVDVTKFDLGHEFSDRRTSRNMTWEGSAKTNSMDLLSLDGTSMKTAMSAQTETTSWIVDYFRDGGDNLLLKEIAAEITESSSSQESAISLGFVQTGKADQVTSLRLQEVKQYPWGSLNKPESHTANLTVTFIPVKTASAFLGQ